MKFLSGANTHFFVISFIFPLILIGFGVTLIATFIISPFLNLKLSTVFTSPIVPGVVKEETGFSEFSFSELSREDKREISVKNVPAVFTLSVPKLGIKGAKVETNSVNLAPDNFLGHYKGTSLPGEEGNVFIYGHSALPIFFNPKDYKTIFSTLTKLSKGDTFTMNYDGKDYTYKVSQRIVLKPSEVDVFDMNPLKKPRVGKTAILMTCVPPGSKTLRLLVVGELVS
ncbi:hypothetical protein A2716_05065 [candidate division WWE3 bacterium RIFCSPHIGHO2_01_FULL_40_23]|uniref:Sortase n=1 Tax=candidate division WWE3 bacterium RIFCSPLOWO2_01_FULL_41_18 TaxID=1802625 RepID=A0A1F4VDD4_UNCKA|nr:MAG: hypothetical protein A2716_05065 [candidate division WWE3 bacterium RIFCSPHIGHO2_01_FULL_40_23]OGC55241.1 MAG: hypothetical protein A3A78_04675 [candidate division WWE3 bacterium RIFCSPLOWO2_01_FULL_41_18]